MPETDAHHRTLAAFVAKHRDQLETYAGSEKATTQLAEATLRWARTDGEATEGQEANR